MAPKLRAALQLAAPRTWCASLAPALCGSLAARALNGTMDFAAAVGILLCSVLLQSAVNSFNDAADFRSGNDTAATCIDPSDAALVYGGVSLRFALGLGCAFLALAAATGAFLMWRCSWQLIYFALAGAAAIALYTLPCCSFSALPLGEALSGLAMGGGIFLAAFYAQAGEIRPAALFLCLPTVISVAAVMLCNNGSDIEKDLSSGRRTLAVCLGRRRSLILLRLLIWAQLLLTLSWHALLDAFYILPLVSLVPAVLNARKLLALGLMPERRIATMAGAAKNCLLGAALSAALLIKMLI